MCHDEHQKESSQCVAAKRPQDTVHCNTDPCPTWTSGQWTQVGPYLSLPSHVITYVESSSIQVLANVRRRNSDTTRHLSRPPGPDGCGPPVPHPRASGAQPRVRPTAVSDDGHATIRENLPLEDFSVDHGRANQSALNHRFRIRNHHHYASYTSSTS